MMRGITLDARVAPFKALHEESATHPNPFLYPQAANIRGMSIVSRTTLAGRFPVGPSCLRVLLLMSFSVASIAAAGGQAPTPRPTIVVDTDAGADDLMAIAFLLSRADVHIEAITLDDGLAHPGAGARNVLRLLALAGRDEIPVYLGRQTPLAGDTQFPAAWRKAADDLPGVNIPPPRRMPETESAAQFLERRLSDRRHPARVLALGPLTNIAEALEAVPENRRTPIEITIMGGALRVRGNLGDGESFQTDNSTAEWNFFVDPVAAEEVLQAGAQPGTKILLIPLDATNQVPIDEAFLRRFTNGARTNLAKAVAQILGTERDLIVQGVYSAWDPLAAAALVDPAIVRTTCVNILVRTQPPETGRTIKVAGGRPNACVALNADRERFYRIFLNTLEPSTK